ncbi:D-alanyl-D-alanine carboxypeptidase/D-alanyl-D-alanine endopeptidase [Longimicrobium sp.]|uniref:D-alanyl-D-alanine carboxypeptidase/D-alanyl-D-alanine endopeptidase n=1 Tax=Longimicrobium sp. TaxID=2029185 RepID=UPI002CC3A602|nr:D-alanyl-D-alanine carboxypeptidase/D-alanyl-D-alanine-endopeptidase [Longimicrobium sp.]HSU14468.1 D-alanyl-D-alanine carboxypeptidase/D-alanyl-D-alanine-endopeptidase [Longimicrobium sp.]
MTMHLPKRISTLLFAPALASCAAAAASTPPPAPAPAPVPARTGFAAALDSIFGDTTFAGANWGVVVKSLETGATLYERNGGKMFVPASNMKLVTGSTALETLGPDFRYRTVVAATGPVANGELRGDLVVVGSGDPTIAADFHGGDARAVFRAWADSLRAHGVRRITGRVIGDDDVFDDVPYGRGWAWDDMNDDYSAEIGGLEFNLGVAGVTVARGAAPGTAPVVTLDPATAYIPATVAARTAAPGAMEQIEVTRQDTGPGIVISGEIPADTPAVRTLVAIRNNTAYFSTVLRETLIASGIAVGGAAVDQDELAPAMRPSSRQTLFTQTSPPLSEILHGFLKPSQNQIGELLLKTEGRVLRGQGTASAGIAAVDSATRAWGLPPRRLAQADGSGLSRYNLVAPWFLIGILEHMRRSPNFQTFYDALPVAGVDGTLAGRMKGTPLQGNVHAKTGTVSNVRSLSGYMTTAAGEPMVFSMIVNHHTVTSRDADRLAEAALLRLYNLPRTR